MLLFVVSYVVRAVLLIFAIPPTSIQTCNCVPCNLSGLQLSVLLSFYSVIIPQMMTMVISGDKPYVQQVALSGYVIWPCRPLCQAALSPSDQLHRLICQHFPLPHHHPSLISTVIWLSVFHNPKSTDQAAKIIVVYQMLSCFYRELIVSVEYIREIAAFRKLM